MIHNLIHQFGVFGRKKKDGETGTGRARDEWERCTAKRGKEIKGKQGRGRGRRGDLGSIFSLQLRESSGAARGNALSPFCDTH